MAKVNVQQTGIQTYEGGRAVKIDAEQALRRSVMACMLWENEFYEDGTAIAERIRQLAGTLSTRVVSKMAIEAREKMHLRHAPLWLCLSLLGRSESLVSKTITAVIQRADELTEIVAMYWKDGKRPLPAQLKKGLAAAFPKFSAYQLAKYDQGGEDTIKLRDILFLVHPKPVGVEQAITWMQLANKTLESPDTWEVALSGGADKKATFERLMAERKLGGLAFLRNLRNMVEAGILTATIREYANWADFSRVLPFRFVAAARACPQLEDVLEPAMLKSIASAAQLLSRTGLLVDVSGSMEAALSTKSDMIRMDAACGLAILLREIAYDIGVYTFSEELVRVAPRRGFALRDAIIQSQPHMSTYLGKALKTLHEAEQFNRLIVISDEQAHDTVSQVTRQSYMLNVASAQNGVGYRGKWIHVDGFSEAIVDYIQKNEETRYVQAL